MFKFFQKQQKQQQRVIVIRVMDSQGDSERRFDLGEARALKEAQALIDSAKVLGRSTFAIDAEGRGTRVDRAEQITGEAVIVTPLIAG